MILCDHNSHIPISDYIKFQLSSSKIKKVIGKKHRAGVYDHPMEWNMMRRPICALGLLCLSLYAYHLGC